MAADAFNAACDRIAASYDPTGHANRLWEKAEGARLQRAKDVIEKLFAQRDDMSVKPIKTPLAGKSAAVFELWVGPNKLANLAVKSHSNSLTIFLVETEDGMAGLTSASTVPSAIDAEMVDELSIAAAVTETLNKISA